MSEIQLLTSDQQWNAAWPALNSLRDELELDYFLSSREDLIANGYELFGLIDNEKIVSVCGLIIYPHVLRGRDCWIYDLATLPTERSKGFGKQMISFVENYAKDRACTRICLHTRLHRTEAQRFYEEHAEWERAAFVYQKEL